MIAQGALTVQTHKLVSGSAKRLRDTQILYLAFLGEFKRY